jgi:hypothetical protein
MKKVWVAASQEGGVAVAVFSSEEKMVEYFTHYDEEEEDYYCDLDSGIGGWAVVGEETVDDSS